MTKDGVSKLLQDLINERADGDQKKWASMNGISPQYVCDVLRGRRDPGKTMLDALNLKKVVSYEICGPKS